MADDAALAALAAGTAPVDGGFDVAAVDTVSPADAALLAQLRAQVAGVELDAADEGYWRSDHALHRFLVARSRKVADAAAMYTATAAHRRAHRCSTLLLKAPPGGGAAYVVPQVMRTCFPWGFAGLDRQGFPVLVERIGAIDLVGVEKAIGPEEFVRWVCWYHELQEGAMRRVCAALGKNRHKMCVREERVRGGDVARGGVGRRPPLGASLSRPTRSCAHRDQRAPSGVPAPTPTRVPRRVCAGRASSTWAGWGCGT